MIEVFQADRNQSLCWFRLTFTVALMLWEHGGPAWRYKRSRACCGSRAGLYRSMTAAVRWAPVGLTKIKASVCVWGHGVSKLARMSEHWGAPDDFTSIARFFFSPSQKALFQNLVSWLSIAYTGSCLLRQHPNCHWTLMLHIDFNSLMIACCQVTQNYPFHLHFTALLLSIF